MLHPFIPLAESLILFIATHTQLRELPTRLATRIIEAALHLSSAGREWLRQNAVILLKSPLRLAISTKSECVTSRSDTADLVRSNAVLPSKH